MLRSRVISGIDTERLAAAVSRPGIDPRIWISYAVLMDDPVVITEDGRQDVMANVLLLPSNVQETARVGAIYAGNGFGFYTPLQKEDEVLVMAPSGDPDQGLVITQRLWSPADPPPTEVSTYPDDLTLVVRPEKSLRISVSGGGKVYLGSMDASAGVARDGDAVSASTQMTTWMNAVSTALSLTAPTSFGSISEGSDVVRCA